MNQRVFNPRLEQLSREEMKHLQWKKLKFLLEHQYARNPFYRNLFDQHNIKPDDIRNFDDFRNKVPRINKQDLIADQKANPPFGSRTWMKKEQLIGLYTTSGTSGLGQEVYGRSRADQEYAGQTWAMGLHWSGVDRGDTCYNTWPGSAGQLAGPDSLTQSYVHLGVLSMHVGTQRSGDKLKMMLRFRPNQITIVPAYLTRLSVLCTEMGIDPRKEFPDLKGIMLATECYSTAWVEKMEAFWGAKLYEMYGSTQQGGGLGFTCEHGVLHNGTRGHIHIFEHMSYVEVLNRETGEPVNPGEEGEIVLTNLDREAAPLIRFSTDDKVVFLPHHTCSCGRAFDAFEAGSIARYDDMIKIKAVNVWPAAIESILFNYDEVEEYRGKVYMEENGTEDVLISLEFKSFVSEDRKQEMICSLEDQIRHKVGVRMKITEAKESLPRFEFKVRRWTDERSKDRDRIFYTAK